MAQNYMMHPETSCFSTELLAEVHSSTRTHCTSKRLPWELQLHKGTKAATSISSSVRTQLIAVQMNAAAIMNMLFLLPNLQVCDKQGSSELPGPLRDILQLFHPAPSVLLALHFPSAVGATHFSFFSSPILLSFDGKKSLCHTCSHAQKCLGKSTEAKHRHIIASPWQTCSSHHSAAQDRRGASPPPDFTYIHY